MIPEDSSQIKKRETPRVMRFRYVYMGLGTFLAMIVFILSDPTGNGGALRGLPFGAGVASTIILSLWVIYYVLLLHISRRALIDYVDLKQFFDKAIGTPEGAGLAIIGVAVSILSVAIIIGAIIISSSGLGLY